MDFFETVEKRHSVRKFTSQQVSDQDLQKILETARAAPSAGGLRAYKILVFRDSETKLKLSEAALGQEFLAEASVLLVFCADPERSGGKYGYRGKTLYSVQDATIAASYSQLAAAAIGLASVWVGAFDDEMVKAAAGTTLNPVAIIPVGYAASYGASSGQ